MRVLPASPRRRRRLVYAAAVAGVAGVFAILAAVINESAGAPQAKLDAQGRPQHYRTLAAAPSTAAERQAAERTLDVFVRSAVVRRDLAASWPLASSTMREGTSRSDWLAGNLPVVPYDAAEFRTASYRLTGSYVGHVEDWDALVLPRGPKGEQRVYSCELHEEGGRWLVDWCYPRTSF